jgi:hypothetical protein
VRRRGTRDREALREGEQAMICEFKGCEHEAKWEALKLFGDRRTLYLCDEHKPDMEKRPESLRSLPFFYELTPIR